MSTPNADWTHRILREVGAARAAGDRAREQALLGQLGERDPSLRALAEQALAAAEATRRGDPGPHNVGLKVDGTALCDFCAALDPGWFYPMGEFEIVGGGGRFLSGDRMYACDECRALIDADDWRAMKLRTGSPALNPAVAVLWSGFRRHRTGPAQPADPNERDRGAGG